MEKSPGAHCTTSMISKSAFVCRLEESIEEERRISKPGKNYSDGVRRTHATYPLNIPP